LCEYFLEASVVLFNEGVNAVRCPSGIYWQQLKPKIQILRSYPFCGRCVPAAKGAWPSFCSSLSTVHYLKCCKK